MIIVDILILSRGFFALNVRLLFWISIIRISSLELHKVCYIGYQENPSVGIHVARKYCPGTTPVKMNVLARPTFSISFVPEFYNINFALYSSSPCCNCNKYPNGSSSPSPPGYCYLQMMQILHYLLIVMPVVTSKRNVIIRLTSFQYREREREREQYNLMFISKANRLKYLFDSVRCNLK
jgi:hypothetical protein